MVLDKNKIYYKNLLEYANKYHDYQVEILIDRMPVKQDDFQLLKTLFPLGNIVMCDDLCARHRLPFYELKANCFEESNAYLILETSAGRVDHLYASLREKGVPHDRILTGASTYSKQMSINELFRLQHFDASKYNVETFSRYAIIIRYLFIESFMDSNKDGYKLYSKYLTAKKYYKVEYNIEKFEKLIRSFKSRGPKNLWIAMDNFGRIIDGSHRMALCMYYDIRNITVRYMNTEERLYSDRKWLGDYFTPQEQEKVISKYYELARKYLCITDGCL